jgi:hypothetical protein
VSERRRLSNAELALKRESAELDALLNDQRFVRFTYWLFREAGIFVPTHGANPYDTSYREGRRALGLEVLHRLKHIRPDILALTESAGNLLAAQIPQEQGTPDDDRESEPD